MKEVIVKGDAIDLTEFPVPKWHYLEGGRYINTFSCIVTQDPDTGVMNVGIYRGMVGSKNTDPVRCSSRAASTGASISPSMPTAGRRCRSPA